MGALDGYAVLVTGGGSGIGLGAARRLIADGATVTICARTRERLERAAGELGAQARWVVADVTNEDHVRHAVEVASEATGGLQVVVACAGGSLHLGPLVSAKADAFRATVDLNVTGTFLTLKHSAPVMAQGAGGSFVAISSIAGPLTHRYLGAYCVGKAAIEMLVRVAADELGASGVRVNAVRPGLVDTDMVTGITVGGPLLDDYLDQMPLRRVGTVTDIAEAIRYLAGPESSWTTGQMLGVDGGHSVRRGPDFSRIFSGTQG